MAETRKLTLKCCENREDTLTLEGPDEDGETSVELHAGDDSITLNREAVVKLHAFLGRLLGKEST